MKRQKCAQIKRIAGRVILYIGVIITIIFCLFPFYWLLSSSLKTGPELFLATPTIWIHNPTVMNFVSLFRDTFFIRWFCNTIIVAISTTAICIFVATLGGYSLTRYRYPGRYTFPNVILFVYMLPPILLAIPLFLFLVRWRITDTLWALIITYIPLVLPYSLWLLRAFFQTIPLELEEAAMIDGASRFRVIIKIVLPLALPGIIATSIYAFIVGSNEYLFAMIFISSSSKKTLPLGLVSFISKISDRWDLIFSGSVIAIIPVLFFFFYVQKFLVEVWGTGGMKG